MKSKASTPRPDTLGAAIRARRKALSLNQADVGRLAGTGRIFIHALEAGKTTVRLDKVLAVLGALGLSLAIEPGKGEILVRDHAPGR